MEQGPVVWARPSGIASLPATVYAFWMLSNGVAFAAERFPPLTSFTSSSPSVMLIGSGAAAGTGFSVAAGDFNGDGVDDFVVSSPSKNSPLGGKGEFEVVWGALGSLPVINLESTPSVSRIIGRPTDQPALATVACANINGDTFDDILIGEPRWSSHRGLCYIIFGTASFPDTIDLASPSLPVLTIVGPAEFAAFGRCAASGDIDGDSYSDALISAYGVDEVIVVRGGPALPSFLDSSVPNERLIHIRDDLHPGQGLGEELACRDVDSDGYDDIFFGCSGNAMGTWSGMAILLYGGPNLPSNIMIGSTDLRSVTITNTTAVDFLGSDVAIADFDGDGEQDLIVAADGVDGPSGQNTGAVYVFYSATALPSSFRVDDLAVPRTMILGSRGQTWWGNGLHRADFDLDGRDDLTMRCASVDFLPATRDTVAVVYGRIDRPDTIMIASDTETSKFASQYHDEHLGRGVVTPDITADGSTDLILSAHGFDLHRGRVLALFASPVTPVDRPSLAPAGLLVVPNPFSNSTTLTFALQSDTFVRLTIYDVRGRRIVALTERGLGAGAHSLAWNGRHENGHPVAQGVYFAQLETSNTVEVQKLILVR